MQNKRQLLVETALQLFYQHGVNSIGINEVLKHSGIAKKTLYNYFASKEELVLATLAERHQRFITWLTTQLSDCHSNRELAEKLFSGLDLWFHNKADSLGNFRGCFFINTAAEFGDPSSAIHQACLQHKQVVEALIAAHMPQPNTPLLTLLCILKEGAIVCAYVNHQPQAARQSLQALLPLLHD